MRAALFACLLLACDGADADVESTADAETQPPPSGAACVPDEAAFATDIKPRVETNCGLCHGAETQFGAPYPLFDYDALLAGEEGARPVDRMVVRLRAGEMPPAGQPRPSSEDLTALLDWATCGENMGAPPDGPNPGGFDSTKPILEDPGEPPADTSFFEWRAPDFVVPQQDDHYHCFTFEAPTDEPRFIKRIETVVGDARVLHHTVLYPRADAEPGTHGACDDGGLNLLYAWAPGQGALQFPEGGLRLEPGHRMTLQVHYNNEGRFDATDASGVRIYHAPVGGPEVAMLTLGPAGFSIPANSVGETTGWCRAPSDFRILASFPHMHGTGVGFTTTIARDGGPEEDVVTLDGWDFESQFIYATPTEVAQGDVLRTSCTFRNEGDSAVNFGPRTADEMCFNFAYVTPPPLAGYCNAGSPPGTDDYTPGECAPDGTADLEVALVAGQWLEGPAPELAGDEAPDGLWVVDQISVYLDSFALPIGTLDPQSSGVNVWSVVEIAGDRAAFDLRSDVFISNGDAGVERTLTTSIAGPFTVAEDRTITLATECGGDGPDGLRWARAGDTLTLQTVTSGGPLPNTVHMTFKLAD